MRFHRPDSGLGLSDKAVASIRAARLLESRIPLWTVEPANELMAERAANEAYLAANPGSAYAVYFPGGGAVQLDLTAAPGAFDAHWINIETGEWGPRQQITGGERRTVAPPDDGNWAAAIIASDNR